MTQINKGKDCGKQATRHENRSGLRFSSLATHRE